MKKSLIFPGQGSQKIGMGKEFFDNFQIAKEVFQNVDDSLSQNLSKLIFDGPLDELTLTENAQPAIMTVSIAILEVLKKYLGPDICVFNKKCSVARTAQAPSPRAPPRFQDAKPRASALRPCRQSARLG